MLSVTAYDCIIYKWEYVMIFSTCLRAVGFLLKDPVYLLQYSQEICSDDMM